MDSAHASAWRSARPSSGWRSTGRRSCRRSAGRSRSCIWAAAANLRAAVWCCPATPSPPRAPPGRTAAPAVAERGAEPVGRTGGRRRWRGRARGRRRRSRGRRGRWRTPFRRARNGRRRRSLQVAAPGRKESRGQQQHPEGRDNDDRDRWSLAALLLERGHGFVGQRLAELDLRQPVAATRTGAAAFVGTLGCRRGRVAGPACPGRTSSNPASSPEEAPLTASQRSIRWARSWCRCASPAACLS